jgi:FkbM family methyltransferase
VERLVKAAAEQWRSSRLIDLLAQLPDRLGGVRPFRRLRSSKPVNRLANALYHAQLVDESMRFAARELLARSGPAVYRPRGRPLRAVIRHRTADLYVLNEIVRHGSYDLPTEAECRLDALGRPPRIVDVGANIGLFGIELFARFPEAVVTAFEPDPANAAVLEDVVRVNGLHRRWKVVRRCAGTANGVVGFAAHGHVGSRIEDSPDAIPVPIVDLFPYLEHADLLKMDIEGSEWSILSDERLGTLEQLVLVVEYHRHACPYPDPREAALQLLSNAGFTSREMHVPRQPEGTGIVWAWK